MKKILTVLLSTMIVFCVSAFPVLAVSDEIPEGVSYRHVCDYADILSDKEERELDKTIGEFAEEYEFDLVVVTSIGVHSYERQEVADDFYDGWGYGYGDEYDGALLLVNVDGYGRYSTGNSWISTCGSGIDYLNDETISSIGEVLTPMLLDGDYANAFYAFQTEVQDTIDATKAAKVFMVVFGALAVGFLGAFIHTRRLKGQLKSVADAYEANDYEVPGSLNIEEGYDHFLFSNVVCVKIEESDGGGSSTHTSSSGRTHGGGGF